MVKSSVWQAHYWANGSNVTNIPDTQNNDNNNAQQYLLVVFFFFLKKMLHIVNPICGSIVQCETTTRLCSDATEPKYSHPD